SRLSGPAVHRYRRGVRRRSDLLVMLLVLTAGVGFGRWFVESAVVDLGGIISLPVALGFTTWGAHPVHGHSGAPAAAFVPTPAAAPAADPGACDPVAPSFVLGIAELKNQVGEMMGDPIECERAIDADGNTEQHTTTGLASYSAQTETVSFTDGWRHWDLSS